MEGVGGFFHKSWQMNVGENSYSYFLEGMLTISSLLKNNSGNGAIRKVPLDICVELNGVTLLSTEVDQANGWIYGCLIKDKQKEFEMQEVNGKLREGMGNKIQWIYVVMCHFK